MKAKKYQYVFSPPPYKGQKTWHTTYPFSLGETIQESLFDQELVIIWRGQGKESERVYEGNLDSYRRQQTKKQLKKKQDVLSDLLSKHKTSMIHRSKKKSS